MINKKQAIGLGFIAILFVALLGLTSSQQANAFAFDVGGGAMNAEVDSNVMQEPALNYTGTKDEYEADDFEPQYQNVRYNYAPDSEPGFVSVDKDYYPNAYFAR